MCRVRERIEMRVVTISIFIENVDGVCVCVWLRGGLRYVCVHVCMKWLVRSWTHTVHVHTHTHARAFYSICMPWIAEYVAAARVWPRGQNIRVWCSVYVCVCVCVTRHTYRKFDSQIAASNIDKTLNTSLYCFCLFVAYYL